MANDVELISTQTISSAVASVDFDISTSGHGIYQIVYYGLEVDAASHLYLRLSDDSGATFEADAGDYRWVADEVSEDIATRDSSTSDTKIHLTANTQTLNTGADDQVNGYIWLFNMNQASQYAGIVAALQAHEATRLIRHTATGGQTLAAATWSDARILPSTGNIDAGVFKLFAYK